MRLLFLGSSIPTVMKRSNSHSLKSQSQMVIHGMIMLVFYSVVTLVQMFMTRKIVEKYLIELPALKEKAEAIDFLYDMEEILNILDKKKVQIDNLKYYLLDIQLKIK